MEEMNMDYIALNNGLKCPVVGIGTFMLSPADAENSVREALKMGYSLVDTANAYVNERAVGRGINVRTYSSPRSSGRANMRTRPLSKKLLNVWVWIT